MDLCGGQMIAQVLVIIMLFALLVYALETGRRVR